ncbi:MAG: penicillin-binding protein 1A [Longimicrobiales bacterium]
MASRLTDVWDTVRDIRIPGWFWLGLGFLVAGGAGVAVGSWKNLCTDCPSIAQIYTYEPQQTSKVYSYDLRLITEIGLERRTPVSLSSLPRHVPEAFIAIEDRRFYQHRGLDWRGIARAVVGVLRDRSLSGGGGSTITQQLARNMWTERLGFEKRVTRKLKEWQVAMALERAYSKDQILEAYMNQIGYAHGWYGLQTAARNYFGKNATDMNPAEAALLAAIANLPERYTPLRHPDAAIRRRNLVLDQMADQDFLTQEEVAKWKSEPVPLERATGVEVQAPYFVEWVRQILDDRFGSKLYTAGLRIYTTLDMDMQAAAQKAMDNGWNRIEDWPDYEHPTYQQFVDSIGGEAIETSPPYVQGMFVAVDPRNGNVRAMIGGRDFNHSKFNRATQAERQAGSSFKPFVYTAALESGIPASYVLLDNAYVMEQPDGTLWRPKNYVEEFRGPTTIRDGLRSSVNLIAIKLGVQVGLESVAQMARRLGIRTEVERFPSSAIGAAEVIPIQMAEAYSSFATLGTRVRPFPIAKVEDAGGTILWEPRPESTRVLDPLVARLGVSLLEDVISSGTGYTAIRANAGLSYEVPAAGKTGTTNDGTDTWFMGFTPNLMAAVWFGLDLPVNIAERATGGGFAAPVWGEFMRRVYFDDVPDSDEEGAEVAEPRPLLEIPEPWAVPDGLITRRVDRKTGLLASSWCPEEDAYNELYLPGTEPTVECDRQGQSFIGRRR